MDFTTFECQSCDNVTAYHLIVRWIKRPNALGVGSVSELSMKSTQRKKRMYFTTVCTIIEMISYVDMRAYIKYGNKTMGFW